MMRFSRFKKLVSSRVAVSLFLILSGTWCATASWAQSKGKGEIAGKITDEETGEELIGATVVVKGTPLGAVANVNGQFQLVDVPLGPQTLEFSFVGYTKTEVAVNVQEGVLVTVNVKIKPGNILQEVVIVGSADIQYSPVRNSTDIQLVNAMKFSEGVLVGISNEQIAKSIDRDASQIVQRISGVSLVDRFVVVRGLDTRYNMTLINGLVGPSSEESSRAFSFDALPSGVIDRIEVEKSPGPHLPGMWGGGVIKIFTRNFATTRSFNFDFTGGYRSGGSSFIDDFVTYDGSSKDWMANGANDRRLPVLMRQRNFQYPDFARYPLENIALARSPEFRTNIPMTTNQSFDKRMSFSYYDSWPLGTKRINSLTSGSYTQERLVRVTKIASEAGTYWPADGGFDDIYIDSTYNDKGDLFYRERPDRLGVDSLYDEQVRLSAVQSLGLLINDNHNVSATLFYNRFGTDQVVNSQYVEKELPGDVIKTLTFRYEQRDILVGQLGGSHRFGQNSVEWTLGTSITKNDVPDLQRYYFFQTRGSGYDTSYWQVAYGRNFIETYQTHYVFETDEASVTGRIDFRKDFAGGAYAKAGGFYDRKERKFFSYRYATYSNAEGSTSGLQRLDYAYKPWLKLDSINAPENFTTTGLYISASESQGAYFFDDESAEGYVAVNYPLFNERLTLYGGARFANYSRVLYDQFNVPTETGKVTLFGREIDMPPQETFYVLPSFMAKYSFGDGKYVLRAVYGHTVDRPQFREQAGQGTSGSTGYYDYERNVQFIGNPAIKNSLIKNADMRFEYYPKSGEFMALGGFYKHIDDPIQLFISNPLTFGAREGYYANTEYAKVMGVELEVRKKFDFLRIPVIRQMSVNVNASYIWSETNYDLGKSNIRSGEANGVTRNLRLQGTSPVLVNTALYYERLESGTLVSAIYNLTWDRLRDYGASEDIGNLVEGRQHRLDLVFKQRITKFLTLKMGVQDVLNQTQRFYRDENDNYVYDPGINNARPDNPENPLRYRGDSVERSFQQGSYYTIGLSLNLQNNKVN